MEEQILKRYIDFIKYFGVRIDDEFVYVHDGHTSVILNSNTEWKEFLGYSILDAAEAVAKELKLKIKWIE